MMGPLWFALIARIKLPSIPSKGLSPDPKLLTATHYAAHEFSLIAGWWLKIKSIGSSISRVNALLYIGSALVVIMLGSGILYLRSRRPERVEAGVNEFSRALHVLGSRHSSKDTEAG